MSQAKVNEFLSLLMTAIANCALYSEDHPLVKEFSVKAHAEMEGLYVNNSLAVTLLGDSLVFNEAPIADGGPHLHSFAKKLKRKGIEKIVVEKGVTPDELKKFIIAIVSTEKVMSTPHISVGMVEVKFGAEGDDVSTMVRENIGKVRTLFQDMSKFRRLDMVSLEDAVIAFVATLKREMNVLRIISPVKSYSEYTYVHATNVSVITLFQAEALGLKGEMLHDVGIAALMHDVGKMFVAKEVLEKPGKLDDAEWDQMKQHPAAGARYLSTLPHVPKLAMIAAFEHHMKFDGSGYPGANKRSKKQHIVSQIIAIADFFDALRTERPYRKAMDIAAIIGLMREGTGKDFNPLLVENFFVALKRIKVV
ncbi:MAG TPA: HD domain-containing phosphohydrolase [Thermodesulfovibrionales bacterium]|nr:HD domain-containing phosphohydrolase [Thermodesulfovibrionales bacterium]